MASYNCVLQAIKNCIYCLLQDTKMESHSNHENYKTASYQKGQAVAHRKILKLEVGVVTRLISPLKQGHQADC